MPQSEIKRTCEICGEAVTDYYQCDDCGDVVCHKCADGHMIRDWKAPDDFKSICVQCYREGMYGGN